MNPEDVKLHEKKEDVLHLLKDEQKHAHHPEHKHHEHHKKPLSSEEMKDLEKRKRFYSKLEHYLSEYAPYAILALVVIAIFLGAIYLSITKLA